MTRDPDNLTTLVDTAAPATGSTATTETVDVLVVGSAAGGLTAAL